LHLWIDIKGRGSLGPGKLRLLRAVAAHHSLAAAARELRMSYRLAWQHLRLIEQRTAITVVEPHRGGSSGGGTVLTPQGRLLVEAYQHFHREMERHMRRAFRRFFADWRSP
jgi:molybdate transport system regulatory protein